MYSSVAQSFDAAIIAMHCVGRTNNDNKHVKYRPLGNNWQSGSIVLKKDERKPKMLRMKH